MPEQGVAIRPSRRRNRRGSPPRSRSAAGNRAYPGRVTEAGCCISMPRDCTAKGQNLMGSSGDGTARADAVITVEKYEPAAYEQPADGPALLRIHVEERFSGDIDGA